MDVSDKKYELEDTKEAESKAVDDLVRENVNSENSKHLEEIPDEDHQNSEKLEMGLDPVSETEPVLDFTKPVEFNQATETPVEIEQSLDESNGVSAFDSLSGEKGFSDPTPDQVARGVQAALDEDNVVSSAVMEVLSKKTTSSDTGAVDLVTNEVVTDVPNSEDVCGDVPEVPHSTENQIYMAATPRLLQRTSWKDCCGLFQILRLSHQ